MAFTKEPYNPSAAADWLVCVTCGTQFPSADRAAVKTCHICDDPRQYVPARGQAFTTLAELCCEHHNEFMPYAPDPRLTFITSTPQIAIGQRAILVRTPVGNVLWDCITLLDEETICKINELGGLKAIVISHPHFYSTHVQWARAFQCPVYIAAEDQEWTTLKSCHHVSITATETEIDGTGAKAIKLGGHFPGSLTLLFDGHLLHADTMMTTPSGLGKWEVDATGATRKKPPGLTTFSFQWSYPNKIPLSADEMARMWGILKCHEFRATHGGFAGTDLEDVGVKGRILESMQIQTRFMGYKTHPLMSEKL